MGCLEKLKTAKRSCDLAALSDLMVLVMFHVKHGQ